MSANDAPPRSGDQRPFTLVWDWPLRIWHWLFAASISASLVTGLAGEVSLMDWHVRLGYCALALLGFRAGWAVWGGRYARVRRLRMSPAKLLAHFRGRPAGEPRTAPGAALAVALVVAVAGQAVTGLYTTDDIFTEGPMVRHAADATVDAMSALHHRLPWVLLALVGVHLLAHVVYALRRDPTPLSMFTGRKTMAPGVEPARHLLMRGLVTAATAGAAVWWALSLM